MSEEIRFEDVTYTYQRGTVALKDINLEIRKGEFLVIVGPNGAGKTTLCLTLNGIVPTSLGGEMKGRVVIGGMDTFEHEVYELAQKVGMVTQNPEAQLLTPNVMAEVAFGAENLGIPEEEILKRIKDALRIVRLSGFEERPPHMLSGGQMQRVAIAAALVMQPEVLVLDEPTSQMDPIGTKEVLTIVSELNKELGITIVMTEHKSDQIANLADRIVVLDGGRIVLEGKPREIFEQKETLNRIHVKLPQVSQLTHMLRTSGWAIDRLPLSVEEAYSQLSSHTIKNLQTKFKEQLSLENLAREDEEPVIETKDLWHTYSGNVDALKGINIRVCPGEFVGIIGQNGAGKTTLVKHFVGLLRPTKGEILIEGVDAKQLTIAELSRKIGLVLQNPDNQLFANSVNEECAFGPVNHGLSGEEVKRRVDEALKEVGLTDYQSFHPLSLSWGDRQKVVVASILAMHPNILVFDEPTTGQDYLGRHQVMDLARRLNGLGHTIIVVSHDMELIAEYAKRTIVMGLGSVLIDGPTRDVFTKTGLLESTFLVPPPVTQLGLKLFDNTVPGILTVGEMFALYADGVTKERP